MTRHSSHSEGVSKFGASGWIRVTNVEKMSAERIHRELVFDGAEKRRKSSMDSALRRFERFGIKSEAKLEICVFANEFPKSQIEFGNTL